MAVNKVFPRVLSKSKDTRVRKKTEMSDALNVRATESLDAFKKGLDEGGDAGNEISNSGNMGVVKPVLGNTIVDVEGAAEGIVDTQSQYSIIGSVADEPKGVVYFFMWHQNPSKHAVLMYDDSVGTIQIVFQNRFFNFYYNSVVQGSVTHVSSAESGQGLGEKTFLYFTDNYNEPRCLDVLACLIGDYIGYNDAEIVEFISMCPITPLRPIVCVWGYDPVRTSSAFRNSRGLQFAYQNVYNNGTVSAFSIYSKLAVNPAYLGQGADPTPDIEGYNFISVRIPEQSQNVDYIKLYGREGNDGAWFYIDDLRSSEAASGSEWTGPHNGDLAVNANNEGVIPYVYYAYRYYGDRLISYVPEDITFKQFDSVPKLAEAFDICNDRSFFGNYVEGFDKVTIDANISYVSRPRPDDFQEVDLKLVPEVRTLPARTALDADGVEEDLVQNRVSGFRLDMSGAPDVFEPGTTLNISITCNPDKNIHLYQAQNSFHSSVFVTHDPGGSSNLKDRVEETPNQVFENKLLSKGFNPIKQASGKVGATASLMLHGGVPQLTIKDLGWDPIAALDETYQNRPSAVWNSSSPDQSSADVCYGTSASNPLILGGRVMTFNLRMLVNNSITKSELSTFVGAALSGAEIVNQGSGGPGQLVTSDVSVIDVKNTSSYSIDLGLNSYDYFSAQSPSGRKVCFVTDRLISEYGEPLFTPPCGYFIVNKADVTFGLINCTHNNIFNPGKKYEPGSYFDLIGVNNFQINDVFLALDLLDIRNEEVLTCIPDIKGGYQNTISTRMQCMIDNHVNHVVQAFPGTASPGNPPFFTGGGVSQQQVLEFKESEAFESVSNRISGWVCLRKSAVAGLINGATDISQLTDVLTSVASKIDIENIYNANYLGGTMRQYNSDFATEVPTSANPNVAGGITTLAIDKQGLSVPGDEQFGQTVQVNGLAPSVFHLATIRRLLGYMELPGRAVGSGGGVDPALDGGRDPFDTNPSGTLVCTRRRLVTELNSQILSSENLINEYDEAENILRRVLGYTLIDGESGPGSNADIGSVNATTLRDGILYYYAGADSEISDGLDPNAWKTVFESMRSDTSYIANELGLGNTVFDRTPNMTANGELLLDGFVNSPNGLGLGYWINPFEYYMGYVDTGTADAESAHNLPHSVNDIQTLNAFDGKLNKEIKNTGYVNINFASFVEQDQLEFTGTDNVPSYTITDPLGWYRQLIPHVEITSQLSFIAVGGDSADRKTFKANAFHDFGVVYSDFYGRQSSVFPLGTTFVPPMAEQEGNVGLGGPVDISIQINNDPPSWAYSYQIVYAGNTSYDKFIQYTVGGGFVTDTEFDLNDDLGVVSTGNIYVSLNYLQGNSDVSYTDAFGARPADGGDTFYQYRPGDKLRVISYNEGGARIYANNVEFDVVDVVTLGSDTDQNPLYSPQNQEEIPKYLTGTFVVLKNNPNASGFSVNSIQSNILPNSSSLWNNRCVVEIYTPSLLRDSDEVAYREIGESYKVLRAPDPSGTVGSAILTHQYNPITLKEGDVYFRRHAVNLAPLSNGQFQSIIQPSGSSIPTFFNFYLESETFSDTILKANQYSYGRAKVVDPNAAEVRRYASIIFSDQDDYTDVQLRLNSYDATKQPFKDLPNSYGSIACILDYNDSLFVLQNTKVSSVPVNRTIVSDASGSETVFATSKVLGVQRFYAGENGCDTNPESVAMYGNTIFWANKQRGEVYKFSPSSGVAIISDRGMKSYFRDMFSTLINSPGKTRVAGGYDAEHNEYIISAYNQNILDFTGSILIFQDNAFPSDTAEDEFIDFTTQQGDLTLEEEQDLLGQLDDALLLSEEFESLEEALGNAEAEVQALIAQISVLQQELNLANTGGGSGNIGDLSAEISDLVQQAANADNEAQAFYDSQVSTMNAEVLLQRNTRTLFEQTRDIHIRILDLLGFEYTLDDSGLNLPAPSSFPTIPILNPPAQITFVGDSPIVSDQEDIVTVPYNGVLVAIPAFLAAGQIASIIQICQYLVDWYDDESQTILYARGAVEPFTEEDIAQTFTTGYGVGAFPKESSFNYLSITTDVVGGNEDADEALGGVVSGLDPRVKLNEQIEIYFELFEIGSAYISENVVEQLEASTLEAQAIAASAQEGLSNVLSQIYEIVLGASTFLVPDLSKEELPESASDYSDVVNVSAENIDQSNPFAFLSLNFINDILATNGEPGLVFLVLESYGQESIGFAQMISNYISLGIHSNVTVPAIEQLEIRDQQAQNAITTRDALAFALARILNTIDVSTDNQFLQALIDGGINPTLAAAITNSYGSTATAFAGIVNSFDVDGDGIITAEEVEAALPTGSLSLAFGSLGGSQTWEDVKSDISGLLEGVFNLAESMGLTGPSDDFQEGFDVSDVEALETLRDALEDSRWSEGDSEFISETVDDVIRIVQGKAESQASLISMYEELESAFQQISLLASQVGYSQYPDGDLTADIQSEIYRGVWHNAVDSVVRDIGVALDLLRDWQNLFSAQFPGQLNTSTTYLSEIPDVVSTIGTPGEDSYWSGYSPIGLDGVNAKNILSGENIMIDLTGDGSNVIPGFSGWLALSSVLSQVNENVKILLDNSSLESSGPPLANLFNFSTGIGQQDVPLLIGDVGPGTEDNFAWSQFPVNKRNLYAVINGIGIGTGDVISDLEGAFVDPSLAFTTQDVANFVSNALNTESEFYNASFADSLVQNLLRPTFDLGFNSNTVAQTGDINQSGNFTLQDVLAFGSIVNTQYDQSVSFSGVDFGLNVPLAEQFSLPGGTLDALQAIADAASGGESFQGTGVTSSFYDQFIEE
jgi:hypothetical protein